LDIIAAGPVYGRKQHLQGCWSVSSPSLFSSLHSFLAAAAHIIFPPPSPLCLLTSDASLRHSQNVCFFVVAAVAAGLAGDKELSVVTFAIGLPQRFYLVCTCFLQPVVTSFTNYMQSHIQEKKEGVTHSASILSFGEHSIHRDV